MKKSPLQLARASYQPKLPASLQKGVVLVEGAPTESVANQAQIQQLFPNTYGMPLIKFEQGEDKEYPAVSVGVILSGGQAPGGHNVISGLYDGLKKLNPKNRLFGFLGGPQGLVDHKYIVYKDGTIKPGKRTRDNMFTSRLSAWKKRFGLDVVEQKLIASRRADTYIPHNFSSSFSGYKK